MGCMNSKKPAHEKETAQKPMAGNPQMIPGQEQEAEKIDVQM